MAATHAVVQIGGKQYSVQPGDVIDVELIDAPQGEVLEFPKVLTVTQDGQTTVGAPFVEGARVTAGVEKHDRDKKIIVFKFKAKTRYRRRQGHRQYLTRLNIREVLGKDDAPAAPAEEKPVVKTARARGTPSKATTVAKAAPKARAKAKKTEETE